MSRIQPQAVILPRGFYSLFWLSPTQKKSLERKDDVQRKDTLVSDVFKSTHGVVSLDTTCDERHEKLDRFKKLAEELYILDKLKAIASWDLATCLPKNAYDTRAYQLETTERMYHEKLVSKETKELLSYFSIEANTRDLNEIEKAILKVIKDEYERDKNLPVNLVQEIKNVETKSVEILKEAREKKDYNLIVPVLQKLVELKRKEAELVGYKYSPYDVLLGDHEPGITTKDLDQIVDFLKREIIPMIKAIRASDIEIETGFLTKKYKSSKLMELSNDLLRQIGFDLNSGRLDTSCDPFEMYIGHNDVRLTTDTRNGSLYGAISYAMHEGGHGLYAQGYDDTIKNTLLADVPSIGLDESQSMLYQTIIGYGLPFWIYYFPKLKEMFPRQLSNVSLEDFYKAINEVDFLNDDLSSQICYVIRYEIEKDLMEGKLEVKDVPKAWRLKMKQYLGRTQVDAEKEIMDEDHWFTGYIGYYPTYILGGIYASQIYNAAKKEIDDLEITIASGNMKVLRDWLREKIYKYGSTETTAQIINRVTGENLNPEYFIQYIKDKYSKIYCEEVL